MSIDSPRKPFNFRSTNPAKPEMLRERDNAAAVPKPPSWASRPAPNLAPTGMSGIRVGLPPRMPSPEKVEKVFGADQKGELTKVFKPIVGVCTEKDNDRRWER